MTNMLKDQMDFRTQVAVSDALLFMAVTGTDRQGVEAVAALRALGMETAAVALDNALAPRRELASVVTRIEDYSVRA